MLGEVILGIRIGTDGSYAGVELVLVPREGPAVFAVINAWLGGESLQAAAEPRGPRLMFSTYRASSRQ